MKMLSWSDPYWGNRAEAEKPGYIAGKWGPFRLAAASPRGMADGFV